jgi:hypothetical protein
MVLDPFKKDTIEKFIRENDISQLYQEYEWYDDTWDRGFPDLFRLEQNISYAARTSSLSQEHLIQVAKWGRHPNPKKITCYNPINITLYVNDYPAEWLERESENAVWILEGQTRGFGPTYCSKLLHFAVPQVFGAIDTRLVRTFGRGDPDSSLCYPLLDLMVIRSGKRWAIPSSQEGWPKEYGTWTSILKYFAQTLNQAGKSCPHPKQYYDFNLREEGVWLPADIETALFRYASQVVEGKKND